MNYIWKVIIGIIILGTIIFLDYLTNKTYKYLIITLSRNNTYNQLFIVVESKIKTQSDFNYLKSELSKELDLPLNEFIILNYRRIKI